MSKTSRFSFILVFVSFIPICLSQSYSVQSLYDELARIKRSEYSNGTVVQYVYDAVGNRTARIVSSTGQSVILTDGRVAPSTGSPTTSFTFTVQYVDSRVLAPVSAQVYIDGTPHTLTLQSGTAANGIYRWVQTGLTADAHTFYFSFTDGLGQSVRFPTSGTLSGPLVSTSGLYSVTIASANPYNDAAITITPNDANGLGDGSTPFTRMFQGGTNITLTAPASVNGFAFQKWQRDGQDIGTTLSMTVSVEESHTFTAVFGNYAPQINLAWQYKTEMPYTRGGAATVTYNGEIYLIGGSSFLRFSKYEPINAAWTELPDIPSPGISEGGAAIWGSKIYAVGAVSPLILIYNILDNSWSTGAAMTIARRGAAVAAIEGKIYVIGGGNSNSEAYDTVEMYDPETNSWTAKSSMPTARCLVAYAVVNDLIYVIGGRDDLASEQMKNTVEVYNPKTNTWSACRSMPTRRSSATATVLEGKIYVMGGFSGSTELALVEEYDPATDTWRSISSMGTARALAISGTVNNRIYVLGGWSSIDKLSVIEEGTPISPVINLTLAPVVANFGNVVLGQSSQLGIIVRNESSSTGTFYINVGDVSTPFELFDTPSSWKLNPGEQFTLNIKFTPNALQSYTQFLSLQHNATNQTGAINLSVLGTGIDLPVGTNWAIVDSISVASTLSLKKIAVSDGKAYLTTSTNKVVVVDIASQSILTTLSFDTYSNSQTGYILFYGDKGYVSLFNVSPGQLGVFDRNTHTILDYIPVGSTPYGLASYDNRIYVTNNVQWANGDPATVTVVDANTGTVTATIPVGINPRYISIDPFTGKAFVTNATSQSVSVINTSTNSVITTLPMPYPPDGVAILGDRAYITTVWDYPNGTVEVIDIANNTVINSIPVERTTGGIAALPGHVFVTNYFSNTVSVIDSLTNAVVQTLAAGQEPNGITADPLTNTIYYVSSAEKKIKIIRQRTGTAGSTHLSLLPSWNLVSFNITPEDEAISGILSETEDGWISYISSYDQGIKTWDYSRPVYANDLTALDPYHGYWMKSSQSTSFDLSISGYTVPVDTPIPLYTGWNLVGYLPISSDALDHAIASLGNACVYVMGFDNGVKTWDRNRPSFVNDLYSLKPSYGYWLKLTEDTSLIYPTSDYQSSLGRKQASSFEYSGELKVNVTPYWSDIWAESSNFEPGHTIKVLDKDGVLCGLGMVADGGSFLIHVYGDDPKTSLDEGAKEGEPVEVFFDDFKVSLGSAINFIEKNSTKILTTDVKQSSLPVTYELSQNYPNPFNPYTLIHYALPKPGFVQIVIYNLKGQQVKTLVNTKSEAGYNTVVWDGCDDSGHKVPSGVYLYKMVAEKSKIINKKMLLLQ